MHYAHHANEIMATLSVAKEYSNRSKTIDLMSRILLDHIYTSRGESQL